MTVRICISPRFGLHRRLRALASTPGLARHLPANLAESSFRGTPRASSSTSRGR
jgi:hypothetical protein